MNRTVMLSAFALAAACNQPESREPEPARDFPAARAEADNTAADNTDRNDREVNTAAHTAEDQGSSDSDILITQIVRQEVVADGSLSATAKNAKIITRQGHVTLRGPVNTQEERATVAAIARRVRGVTDVDNRLEVIVASNRTE